MKALRRIWPTLDAREAVVGVAVTVIFLCLGFAL